MITRFEFVLFLCLYGCITSSCNANDHVNCNPCSFDECSKCYLSTLPTTQCPDTTYPTPNPSVCNCSTNEVVDCSQCSTATKTTTTTTTRTTSSAYPEPAQQKSGLCLDNQASSPGPIIGAAIGGAFFGSILTAIVFVYFRRRTTNPCISKKDQTSKSMRNAAYGYTNDIDQVNSVSVPVNSAYSEINDGMRKSAVISPIMRQADSSNTEEVYNHLGESEKEDRSDYYDHAGPAPSLSVMEDGYGVLSMESKGNDKYNTVGRDYSTDCGKSMTVENKQSNDYFILETQNN